MSQTRELLSLRPDGTGVVFTQELRSAGWYNTYARTATPEDLQTMTSPNEQPPVIGRSGSSNSHARLSPSDAERWTTCTAALAAEAEAADKIFLLDYANVRDLIPYLKTFPDELHPHEKRAIEIVEMIDAGKLSLKKLTPEQREDIRRSEGNVNSREGTRAHDFAEAILNGRRTLDSIPEEFRMHIDGYIRYARMITPEGAEAFIESKVPLFYDPGERGTLDYGFLSDERVGILDLKYGAGDLVVMQDNKQLATYALSLVRDAEESAMYAFEPDTVIEIHVYQPRHHEAASLKPWILTLADLEAFCAAEIQGPADHVVKGEGLEFVPTKRGCKYCKVGKVGCAARYTNAASFLDMPNHGYTSEQLLAGLPDMEDLAELEDQKPRAFAKAFNALQPDAKMLSRLEYATNGKVSTLDDETLLMLKIKKDAIIGLIEDAEAYIDGRVLSGDQTFKGLLKIALGREGNRKWKNEEEADRFCINQGLKAEERYGKPELLGPAAIEKIPAIAAKLDAKTGVARTKTRFAELIERSPAKKVVVLASDDRPAVSAISADLPEILDDVIEDEVEDYG